MKYSLRPATMDDFDFMFKLKKQNLKCYVENWEDDFQKDKLRTNLEKHLEHKRIITLDNKDIGVYASHITDNGDYYLNEINILKEYQNKGLGTLILTNKLEENQKQKRRTILQIFKTNPAISLYKRLGFTIYSENEIQYQMEKSKRCDKNE